MTTTVILRDVRLSYLNVFKPRKASEKSDPKFSVSILLPKNHPQIAEVKAAIRAQVEEKWPDPKKRPNGLHNPMRDGDVERENDDAYKGHFFINASSAADRPPMLLDGQLQPVTDTGYWVSGDYGNVKVDFYPFAVPENKGVGVGLVTVQFKRKGDPLGNRTNPMEGFEVEEGEEKNDIFG
jgi:hypothetical protein